MQTKGHLLVLCPTACGSGCWGSVVTHSRCERAGKIVSGFDTVGSNSSHSVLSSVLSSVLRSQVSLH